MREIKKKFDDEKVMSVFYIQRKYNSSFKEGVKMLTKLCQKKTIRHYVGKNLVRISK